MKLWFLLPLLSLLFSPVWLERFYDPGQSRTGELIGVSEGGIGVPPGEAVSEGGIGVPPGEAVSEGGIGVPPRH